MEIWKEFFKLKFKEIYHWATSDLLVILAMLLIIAAGSVLGLIISNLITSTKYIAIIFLIICCIYIIYLIINYLIFKPIKWLRSNWKQAKKNVEERHEKI